jgi:hypothetical protein
MKIKYTTFIINNIINNTYFLFLINFIEVLLMLF